MGEFWDTIRNQFSGAKHEGQPAPVQTVPYLDLDRYLGDWFEIATIPRGFQKDCTATRATYSLRSDGEIDVVNSCRLRSPDGPEKKIHGRARVVDKQTNAKLKVSFFWPFWSDYQVIELGDNYEYAVVTGSSRDYLWILSRTPEMAPAVYDGILQRLRAQGFDIKRLRKTKQK